MKCYEISGDKGQPGIRPLVVDTTSDNPQEVVLIGQIRIPVIPGTKKENGLIQDVQPCYSSIHSCYSNVPGRGMVDLRNPVIETDAILVKWDIFGRDAYVVMTEGEIVAIDYEGKSTDDRGMLKLRNASILVVLMPGQSIYAEHQDLGQSISVFYRRLGAAPEIKSDGKYSAVGYYPFEGHSSPNLLRQDA